MLALLDPLSMLCMLPHCAAFSPWPQTASAQACCLPTHLPLCAGDIDPAILPYLLTA